MNLRPYLLLLLLAIAPACASTIAAAPGAGESQAEDGLAAAIAGGHRSEANKARDQYRHPAETLRFFGIRNNMTVVEIAPGGGWYTEIFAPYLRESGTYYAASLATDSTREYSRKSSAKFLEKLKANPEIYDKVKVTVFEPPLYTEVAPAGSADMVLTFRNVHNWLSSESGLVAFNAFHRALKPGGILGVVEHRADPSAANDPTAPTGYVPESTVIGLAEAAGFELVGKSEINANPRDTKNHPKGVWTLPPSYSLGDADRARYEAIGESDRMTLKFIKK